MWGLQAPLLLQPDPSGVTTVGLTIGSLGHFRAGLTAGFVVFRVVPVLALGGLRDRVSLSLAGALPPR